LNADVTPKGLELLCELIPQSKSFSVLVNPSNRVNFDIVTKGLEGPSRAFGLQLHFLNASTESELESVFAKLAQLQVGGLIIGADTFFNSRAKQLAALTLNHAVPAVHTVREFAVSGGLMSYGGNIRDTHRQAGIYTGRVLKGEKPADLPVQRATKVELSINLDCQGTRPQRPQHANRASGRGDRIGWSMSAQSRQSKKTRLMSLWGVKQTWLIASRMSAFDPKRTPTLPEYV
jgi:ABC-type uncharacterized transport system substrate-binding protein